MHFALQGGYPELLKANFLYFSIGPLRKMPSDQIETDVLLSAFVLMQVALQFWIPGEFRWS